MTRNSKQRLSKFIAEERRAGMPIKQAVAVGFSREKHFQEKMRLQRLIAKYGA